MEPDSDKKPPESAPKEPTSYVIGARVSPEVYEWINAYARHILADSMGTCENRSAAIKACFDITFTALSPQRMDALRDLRRKRGIPIKDVLADVIDAGLAALRSGK